MSANRLLFATTAVRSLEAAGVPPDRLAASGRAEYSPVAYQPEVARLNERAHVPRNTGLRFSLKARTPSRRSSVSTRRL